jgi:large subunit ribosomal protein L4
MAGVDNMAIKKTIKKVVKNTGFKMPVVGVDGKAAGTITLPEAFFGAKENKQLIAQAVRVYMANQRTGHAATKTRGMVEGSTRKIYKQKGTGRARHGGIRAPIFVGGGIVFGPQPRDFSLKFPQKMKKAALASALSQQYAAGNIIVVSGLADLKPKTKLFAKAFENTGLQKNILFVVSKEATNVKRGARNIANVDIIPVSDLHTYGVVTHNKIVFMKEALKAL